MLGLLEVLPSNDRRWPGVPPSRTEREKSSTIRLVRRVKPAVGVGDDALELPVGRPVPCAHALIGLGGQGRARRAYALALSQYTDRWTRTLPRSR